MKKLPLDIYDDMPEAMRAYLTHNGWHFSKKACEYAVSKMKKMNPSSGRLEPIEPWDNDRVKDMLTKYGVKLENDTMYDACYQANWCKADLFRSSIPDEAHVALFVKDTLDDADGTDEMPFRSWLQKCIAMGEPVEWEDLL